MKKVTSLILVFYAVLGFSQMQFYTGSRDFLPVEILMEDGSVKKGFAQEFMLPDVAKFQTGLGSGEKNANLTRKEVKFKSSQNQDSPELVHVSDLKSIVYFADEPEKTFQYDKKILKELNNDINLESDGKVLMLPLIRKGAINLYGFNTEMCQGTAGGNGGVISNGKETRCTLIGVSTYISRPNQDFAISPLDLNSIGTAIFNRKVFPLKFYKAYEIIGGDCPEFKKKIDEAKSKEFFSLKAYNKNRNDFNKQRYALQKTKNAQERAKLEEEMNNDVHLQLFTQLIKDYENSCK